MVQTEKKGGGRRDLGVVKNNGKNVFINFNKDVQITFKGEKIDLGEFNCLFFTKKDKAMEDLEFKLEKGWVSEKAEEVQRRILADEEVKYLVSATLAAE